MGAARRKVHRQVDAVTAAGGSGRAHAGRLVIALAGVPAMIIGGCAVLISLGSSASGPAAPAVQHGAASGKQQSAPAPPAPLTLAQRDQKWADGPGGSAVGSISYDLSYVQGDICGAQSVIGLFLGSCGVPSPAGIRAAGREGRQLAADAARAARLSPPQGRRVWRKSMEQFAAAGSDISAAAAGDGLGYLNAASAAQSAAQRGLDRLEARYPGLSDLAYSQY